MSSGQGTDSGISPRAFTHPKPRDTKPQAPETKSRNEPEDRVKTTPQAPEKTRPQPQPEKPARRTGPATETTSAGGQDPQGLGGRSDPDQKVQQPAGK